MKKERLLSAVILGGALAFFIYAGYFVYQTFQYTGEDAIGVMSPGDRQLLASLKRITPTMSAQAVSQLLGEPTAAIDLLAKWQRFGGSNLSELRVYFHEGHPQRIVWMKLGSFIYEKDLQPADTAQTALPAGRTTAGAVQ